MTVKLLTLCGCSQEMRVSDRFLLHYGFVIRLPMRIPYDTCRLGELPPLPTYREFEWRGDYHDGMPLLLERKP